MEQKKFMDISRIKEDTELTVANTKGFEIGDLIAYQVKGLSHITVHRVVEIIGSSKGHRFALTQGDNNPQKDNYYITEDMFLGIVRCKGDTDYYE